MLSAELQNIRGSSLFRGFSDQDLAVLAPLLSRKSFSEGAIIFLENMPGENLYLILKGTVQISKMMAEGDERTLAILSPEDYFGEMALFEGGVRMVCARAVEEAELFCLGRSDFDSLCNGHPALALKLARNLIQSLGQRLRDNETEFRKMLRWSVDGTS